MQHTHTHTHTRDFDALYHAHYVLRHAVSNSTNCNVVVMMICDAMRSDVKEEGRKDGRASLLRSIFVDMFYQGGVALINKQSSAPSIN